MPKTCVFFKFGFGDFREGRRLQPSSHVALIGGSGCITKLTFSFAPTTLNGQPATETLLHDARISQRGLINVDKIGMTTPNSNSDVIISMSQHVSYVTQKLFQLEVIL